LNDGEINKNQTEDTGSMKISDSDQILKNLYPEANSKAIPSTGKEFGAILKETVEKTSVAESESHQTTLLNPLSPTRLPAPEFQDRNITIERTEKMIDLLDQYCQMLADPKTTLKEIEPIIKELGLQKEKMTIVLDSLNDNEGLKDILNQTLVTASVEISKFYRGDYVAV
jgi:hypothetical protein